VTETYLIATLDAVRNREARSIDGEPPAGAIPFPGRRDGTNGVKAAPEAVLIVERSVSNPHA